MYMCIPQSKIPLDQVYLFIIIIIFFIFCMNVDVQSPELAGMYILTWISYKIDEQTLSLKP